jgi:putative SOS response-associated peptidase YedK
MGSGADATAASRCLAAWASEPYPLSSLHVWPRAPLVRCQRDQAGLLDTAASTDPELRAQLERGTTDLLPVVRYDRRASERSLDLLRWGLIPHWAKDINVGFANINAKAEGIENRPAFREAFQRRRCLVPVDNFYEWKKTATGKQPYAVALADRRLMALAGLWENWRSPAGEWMRSFAIVTTEPNALCAELHNRMPVVLGPQVWPAWLDEEPADAHQLKAMLALYPSEEMVAWPVSARVGNVKNNDPSLIEPVG